MDGGNGSGRPPGTFPLAAQGSIYSLTFDELQNTIGSVGKDFGSMNMDELLKNIWNAGELQTMSGAHDHGGSSGTNLQRQGSLTLPRTLSHKTVDEVWKDLSKGYSNGFGLPNLPQRQQTLGEMTLEEFLVKAGVVREEPQLVGKPNDDGLFSNLTNSQNRPRFDGVAFPQAVAKNVDMDVMGNFIPDNGGNQMTYQSAGLPLSVNGVQSTQLQQQGFPKQANLPYATPMAMPSSDQLGCQVNRNRAVGVLDPLMNTAAALQGGMGRMVGLGVTEGVTVAAGSPAVSSDGTRKSNGVVSSVSPAPYVSNGVLRGRRGNAVEKVVERRQRRMIKNRESAARSRARKQAYTMELEAEVSKLKEKNQELKRKQVEMIEMQKNQVIETMNMQLGGKRHCLRMTLSGPW